MIIDDFDEPSSHFFPSFPTEKTENVVPLAEFIFKKLKSLNTSFRTSDDIDERLDIAGERGWVIGPTHPWLRTLSDLSLGN